MKPNRLIFILVLILIMIACSFPFGMTAINAPTTPSATPVQLSAAAHTSSATETARVTVSGASEPTQEPIAQAAPPRHDIVSAPQILSFKMFNQSAGWALGDQNLLRTTDGGLTWTDETPAGAEFSSYPISTYFSSSSAAWVLIPDPADPVNWGTLYVTADAGQTWASQSVPFAVGKIQFLDQNTGFVLTVFNETPGTADAALFQTSDAGKNWTRYFLTDPSTPGSLPQSALITGFVFTDALHGWLTGSHKDGNARYFYSTIDGGKNWAAVDVVANADLDGAHINTYPPMFLDPNTAVLPMMVDSLTVHEFAFFLTQDAGKTWLETTPVNYPADSRYDVVSVPVWAAWTSKGVAITNDAGFSWNIIPPDQNFADSSGDYVQSLDFVSTSAGWILTMNGSLHRSFYRTLDGGYTWEALIP